MTASSATAQRTQSPPLLMCLDRLAGSYRVRKKAARLLSFTLPAYSDPHIAALATPVFGVGPTLIGAIAIAGPMTQLTPKRAQLLEEVLAEAGIELTELCSGMATPLSRETRRDRLEAAACG